MSPLPPTAAFTANGRIRSAPALSTSCRTSMSRSSPSSACSPRPPGMQDGRARSRSRRLHRGGRLPLHPVPCWPMRARCRGAAKNCGGLAVLPSVNGCFTRNSATARSPRSKTTSSPSISTSPVTRRSWTPSSSTRDVAVNSVWRLLAHVHGADAANAVFMLLDENADAVSAFETAPEEWRVEAYRQSPLLNAEIEVQLALAAVAAGGALAEFGEESLPARDWL